MLHHAATICWRLLLPIHDCTALPPPNLPQRWDEGRWWWLSGANQTVFAGPEMHQTCRRARAFGIIA